MSWIPGTVPTTADERREAVHAALVQLMPAYGYVQLDPLVPLAQAEHETNHFTSSLCVTFNNAFGMFFPSVRPTVAVAVQASGYAVYDNLFDSVQDYLMRQQYFDVPDTSDPTAYIAATMASHYATDPNYAKKWADLVPDAATGGGDAAAGAGDHGAPATSGVGTFIAAGLLVAALAPRNNGKR